MLVDAFVKLWSMFLLLSPYFLLGLFIAGLLHILVSKKQITAWIGDRGMKGVLVSSTLGITVPICTCGVAPVGVELKKKGASDPAIISFLITTPETALDAILVTIGLLGPVMAIARPIYAYCMGIFAGFFAIGLLPDADEKKEPEEVESLHQHCHPECQIEESVEQDGTDFVGFEGLLNSVRSFPKRVTDGMRSSFLCSWYGSQEQNKTSPKAQDVLPLREIFKRTFKYSFEHFADEVIPGLIMGMFIAFLVFIFIPDDLAKYGIGKSFFSYLIMLAIGMPLYVCASGSTPIAAAFIHQGISPGAALVFLLAAPSTNMTTLTVLARNFGKRFFYIYLLTLVVGGILVGISFDYLLHLFDWDVQANISSAHGAVAGIVEWMSALALLLLIAWRLWRGNLREEIKSLFDIKGIVFRLSGVDSSLPWKECFSRRSRLIKLFLPLSAAIYFATGLTIVPVGAVGYVRLFGHVITSDLKPGLHYILPRPLATMDILYPNFPYQVTVGIPLAQDKLSTLQTASQTVNKASPQTAGQGLPLPFSATEPEATKNLATSYPKAAQVDAKEEARNQPSNNFGITEVENLTLIDKQSAEFFSGDENLFDLTASVQYKITDPYKYLYQINTPQNLIAGLLRSCIFKAASSGSVLKMLSEQRQQFEQSAHSFLEPLLKELGAGIISVNIVDLHPPVETIPAFIDVVSAREDRETSNLKALKMMIETILRSRGNAQTEVQRAEALALTEQLQGQGMQTSIEARASIVSQNRKLLEDLLWIETSERALSKQNVYLLPSNYPAQKLSLWKNSQHSQSLLKEDGKKGQNQCKKSQK